MYGSVKARKQIDGSVVGKFAGIVTDKNLQFVQKLANMTPKLTETGLCNKLLNTKLDELRETHELIAPETKEVVK